MLMSPLLRGGGVFVLYSGVSVLVQLCCCSCIWSCRLCCVLRLLLSLRQQQLLLLLLLQQLLLLLLLLARVFCLRLERGQTPKSQQASLLSTA